LKHRGGLGLRGSFRHLIGEPFQQGIKRSRRLQKRGMPCIGNNVAEAVPKFAVAQAGHILSRDTVSSEPLTMAIGTSACSTR